MAFHRYQLKLLRHRVISDLAGPTLIGVIALMFVLVMIGIICSSVDVENNWIRGFFDISYSWDPNATDIEASDTEITDGINFIPFAGLFGAIFISGLLVSLFVNFIQREIDRIRDGYISYHFNNHIVIIGFDEIVPSIVKQLVVNRENEESMIVICSGQDIIQIRDKVYSKLKDKKLKNRVVFLHSIRHSKKALLKLYTTEAKELYIIGDRSQSDHDSENMHIMKMLSDIHGDAKAKKIPVSVWFEQEASFSALQLNDIKSGWKDFFEFIPYNFYKSWANRVLVSGIYQRGKSTIHYPELDRGGIKSDSKSHIHLVIVGMNRMGVSLAKEAAHLLHFPNFDECTQRNQTVITFIDDNADREMRFFQGRHPGYFEIAPTYYWDASLQSNVDGPSMQDNSFFRAEHRGNNLIDVRFQFIKGRIESDTVRGWLVKQAQDKSQYLTVAICLNDPSKALGAGLYLPEEMYYGSDEKQYTNILIRQETSSAMVEDLRESAVANQRMSHVYPFGMLDNCIDLNSLDITMAQAFNYIYDYYFAHSNLLPLSLPPKDEMIKLWENISVSNQWSNIYLADSFKYELHSISYDIDSGAPLTISDEDKMQLSRVEHNRWNMEKLLIGYRALHKEEWDTAEEKEKECSGGKKQYLNKLKKAKFVHYCLVPYSRLSQEEKVLDENIITALPMVLEYARSSRNCSL